MEEGVPMPIHDWTKMLDGDFHDFHESWIIELRNALNRGLLPDGFKAMADQVTGRPSPDVVTLRTSPRDRGGLAVKPAPPTAKLMAKFERKVYAERANRIVIRHGRGEVVAIIEIVSAGNKHGNIAFRKFVQKSMEFMDQGIHMLIVDVHPPTNRDPNGLQQALAGERYDMTFELPPDKNRTAGSYFNGEVPAVYLESFGIGDSLPSLPIFLTDIDYVYAPLEESCMQAWEDFPRALKDIMLANG